VLLLRCCSASNLLVWLSTSLAFFIMNKNSTTEFARIHRHARSHRHGILQPRSVLRELSQNLTYKNCLRTFFQELVYNFSENFSKT
jgi:hypothetical protein